MQLRPDALDAHLAKPLAPLYVITSDEHLLALEAADKIRKAARTQGFSEREVLTVERNFKWGELLAASQSQSLFGDKKLIELRLPTGKPGKDGGQALQQYAAAVSQVGSDTVTIITLPKLDWATQKSAWVGALRDKRSENIFAVLLPDDVDRVGQRRCFPETFQCCCGLADAPCAPCFRQDVIPAGNRHQ